MNPDQSSYPRHQTEESYNSFPDQSDRAGYLREHPLGMSGNVMYCNTSYGVSVEMSNQFWCEGGQR